MNTIASATSSSPTTTTSSTHRSISASVSPPGRLTAIPSAIVSAESTATGAPAASEARTGAQVSTWTPMTSISGRADLSAIATPLINPPPPTGTITRASSGTCASSSSPIPPWPAITSGSSNGCTNARPPSAARSRASSSDSSTIAPARWTVAPSAVAASTLAIDAAWGMNTSHGMARARAA